MQITIENFCGIKSAAFELTKQVLIAGDNAAGKSSIAKAVAAALSGSVVPVPGVLKNMAGMLVRSGAAKGSVLIQAAEGEAQVEWPRATLKTKGTPPAASVTAVGLESLVAVTPKERAAMLVDLLQAVPTRDDLAAYLKPHGVNDDTIGNLWEVISRNGWDAACNQAKETGARLKGQWEITAGDRYGSKKAEAFTPSEWEPELAGASEDALKAAVTDARDALDGMIAITAVDDAEQQRLQALADQVPELQEAVDKADGALAQANAVVSEIRGRLNAMPDPSKPPAVAACPHCGEGVKVVNATTLEKPREFTQQDSDQYAAIKAELESATVNADAMRAELLDKQVALRASKQAAASLQQSTAGNATQQQVDGARNALALAERRLNAFVTKTKADRISGAIQQNLNIVAALDMAGVRQQKLGGCVQAFLSEEVNPLAQVAGWHPVGIDGDMAITYGERAWSLLSESEKYRVRVLLQVAIAIRDRSAAVVIDAADILGKAGRNGLIKLLRAAKVPALVCMTINAVNEVPDLNAAGIGASYWIEESVLGRLDAMKATRGNNAH